MPVSSQDEGGTKDLQSLGGAQFDRTFVAHEVKQNPCEPLSQQVTAWVEPRPRLLFGGARPSVASLTSYQGGVLRRVTDHRVGRASRGWRLQDKVPWTVSWTAEDRYELEESQDFPGLVDLVQLERPGEGLPRFTALHVTRLRLGMARHICHVCGRPTPRTDRYLLPVQSGGFVTVGTDSSRYAANVPPLHLACTRKAQHLCPHLRQATIPPIAYPSEESCLMPRRDVVEGMEALATTLPADLPVVFSCCRLFGPRFSRKILEMRRVHAANAFVR